MLINVHSAVVCDESDTINMYTLAILEVDKFLEQPQGC